MSDSKVKYYVRRITGGPRHAATLVFAASVEDAPVAFIRAHVADPWVSAKKKEVYFSGIDVEVYSHEHISLGIYHVEILVSKKEMIHA
jgi:hypothetical protein